MNFTKNNGDLVRINRGSSLRGYTVWGVPKKVSIKKLLT